MGQNQSTVLNRVRVHWDLTDPQERFAALFMDHLNRLPSRERNRWIKRALLSELGRFMNTPVDPATPSMESTQRFLHLMASDMGITLEAPANAPPLGGTGEPHTLPAQHATADAVAHQTPKGQAPAEPDTPATRAKPETNERAEARESDADQAESEESASGTVANTSLGRKLANLA